jgi:20S proteasome subunit beta 6
LLVGLDENNDGVIYGYDAVGSFDKLKYGVMGSG